MDSIFPTREIATAIWFIIILIFCFVSSKIRLSAIGIIKSAYTPKLSVPFIFMIAYASLLVFLQAQMPFWKWLYIKDICIWVIFAGIPSCYKAISKNYNDKYFCTMILDNLKFMVLVEFIISSLPLVLLQNCLFSLQ